MESIQNRLGKIYDILISKNSKLSLPKIVVIGSQSVGKSSLLQTIIGKNILPTGHGTVTRCPTQIHLLSTPQREYFQVNEKQFPTAQQARKYIEKLNKTLVQEGKLFSLDPVVFRYYQTKKKFNLNLVDLPGFIVNQTDDQKNNLAKEKVAQMAEAYVNDPLNIILLVDTCSVDLKISPGIQFIRKMSDDIKKRCIMCLTNIDSALVNPHKLDFKTQLDSVQIQPKRCIGVFNKRGQNIKQVQRKVQEIAQSNNYNIQIGFDCLVSTLAAQLKIAIDKERPFIIAKIGVQLTEMDQQLFCLEKFQNFNSKDFGNNLIDQFTRKLWQEVHGVFLKYDQKCISFAVRYKLETSLRKIFDPDSKGLDNIDQNLNNSLGISGDLMFPFQAVLSYIRELLQPIHQVIKQNHREISSTISFDSINLLKSCKSFKTLIEIDVDAEIKQSLNRIVSLISTFLQDLVRKTERKTSRDIQELIERKGLFISRTIIQQAKQHLPDTKKVSKFVWDQQKKEIYEETSQLIRYQLVIFSRDIQNHLRMELGKVLNSIDVNIQDMKNELIERKQKLIKVRDELFSIE